MIAVVGAGPAGLACAAMLQRSGEQVVVFERGHIGAAWTTRYDRLHLHTVRWLSCLPGHRMPREYGKWPSHDRVLDYLRRYAERAGLAVRTGVEVERIDRDGAGWRLETSRGAIEADRVVVATGHSNVPYLPEWPGAFAGEFVHSADYRNPAPFVGRRVLVVGGGNSGAEIAADLADGGCGRRLSRRAHAAEHRPGATRSGSRARCSASRQPGFPSPSSTGSPPRCGGSRFPTSRRTGCPRLPGRTRISCADA